MISSATADIEGVLIRGAQGVCSLTVALTPDLILAIDLGQWSVVMYQLQGTVSP
jgi:hypothetical protein